MARKGIRPLSTAIARAFSSGSSTTSQRPTPKKRTNTRITPAQPAARRTRKRRERLRRTEAGFSVFAIKDPAHTIAGRRSGQSAAVTVHCRFFAEDACVRWSPAGRVDYVLHFASPASPVDYLKLPIPTMKVGALGTHNALGLTLAKNAKFLLASTSECYGDPEISPQHEEYWGHVNPIGPRGVYDEAKRYAEAMTMAYHRFHGVDTRIVRIFNTYGPRMRLNDGRALPN